MGLLDQNGGYDTGFYGIPGRVGGSVHIRHNRKPICGYRPSPRAEWQWCAWGVKPEYVECPRCRERGLALLKHGEEVGRG